MSFISHGSLGAWFRSFNLPSNFDENSISNNNDKYDVNEMYLLVMQVLLQLYRHHPRRLKDTTVSPIKNGK